MPGLPHRTVSSMVQLIHNPSSGLTSGEDKTLLCKNRKQKRKSRKRDVFFSTQIFTYSGLQPGSSLLLSFKSIFHCLHISLLFQMFFLTVFCCVFFFFFQNKTHSILS